MATRTPADTKKRAARMPQVLNVTVQTLNRQSQDIGKWRTALRSADNNRRKLLYDLYEDVLLDTVLSDAIEKRVQAITNADLLFTVNDQEVDEINDLMETEAWGDMLTEIMNARFWGVTLFEFDYTKSFDAFSWPRTHIDVKNRLALMNENDQSGISYTDDPFFLEVKPRKTIGREGFGLILKACPYVIYKRGGFGDWAQFAELFGMPFRVGKYNSYDDAGRIQLEAALSQAGSAAYAVIPKDSDLEFINNNSNGDGSLFDKLRKACNEEILYVILGQSMTTVQGDKGARSLGEVQMDVQESKHADDRRFVSRILNSEILPRMEARGFPVKGGKFSFPEIGETLSLTDRIDIDQKLNDIVEIEPDYFYETYGLPKPKNGGGLKPKAPTAPPTPPTPPAGNKQNMADNEPPSGFWERFYDFFVKAPVQTGAGNHHTSCNCGNMELADLGDFDQQALFERIAQSQPVFDVQLFEWIKTKLLTAFRSGWDKKRVELADFGFDYGFTNEVAQTMMETNLFHFSGAKTLAECQELNRLFRESKSFGEFTKEAEKVTDVFNKQWLQTEYDTAYQTAESSATYYRLLEQTDIFPYWEYRTAGDNNVRAEHAALNGLILPADDPRWKKIMPPNGWNCRCYIVPRTRAEVENIDFKIQRDMADRFIGSPEFKKEIAQGWGVNRAELKQVFTENQFYVRKFPGKAAKPLDQLTAPQWGLKPVSTKFKEALNPVSSYTGTTESWKNAADKIAGDAIVKDYNKRSLVLTDSVLKKQRTDLLSAFEETLKQPAEVWIQGKQLDTYALINYYTDEAVVVFCRVEGGAVNYVEGWKALSAGELKQYRTGLLIKY